MKNDNHKSDRKKDRQTGGQTVRRSDGQTDGRTDGETERWKDGQKDIWTYGKDGEKDKQKDRQTDRITDGQDRQAIDLILTDRQTGRHAHKQKPEQNRHVDMHTKIELYLNNRNFLFCNLILHRTILK